jgi:hypothetical protein
MNCDIYIIHTSLKTFPKDFYFPTQQKYIKMFGICCADGSKSLQANVFTAHNSMLKFKINLYS